eukprot:980493_1
MTQDVLPTQGIFTDQVGNDIGAMFAILIGAMIAAGGGLGGGGVFVPIYILILAYPPKFAAALSQATIFGGSIVNLIMNLRKFHPTRKHRPLTDFSTLLIFEPMLLVGTIVGVLLNVMFPDILILICLALVLSYATVRTTRKGIRLWKKETNEMKTSDNNPHPDNDDKAHTVNVELQTVKKDSDVATDTHDDTDKDINDSNNDENNNQNNQQNGGKTDVINQQQVTNGDENHKQDNDNDTNNDHNDKHNERTDVIHPDATLPDLDSETGKHPKRSSKDGLMTESDDARVKDVTQMKHIIASASSGEMLDSINYSKAIVEIANGCGVPSSQITEDKVEICTSFVERETQILKPSAIILVVWFFVSLFSILKKESITGVDNCGAAYWVITFLPFPIMMAVSYFMTKKEYDFYNEKINSGCWVPAFGDIQLDGDFIKILKYPLIASIAGILGGLLGIGGGMIVSPLLIELGVIPTVAAATSAMAVMITSSSAMLQFLLLGFLQWDYTLFFMCVGVLGTYVGQTAVNYAVKEYGRVSVVIFAVAVIMGLAIILMLINGLISLVDGVSWA